MHSSCLEAGTHDYCLDTLSYDLLAILVCLGDVGVAVVGLNYPPISRGLNLSERTRSYFVSMRLDSEC